MSVCGARENNRVLSKRASTQACLYGHYMSDGFFFLKLEGPGREKNH